MGFARSCCGLTTIFAAFQRSGRRTMGQVFGKCLVEDFAKSLQGLMMGHIKVEWRNGDIAIFNGF